MLLSCARRTKSARNLTDACAGSQQGVGFYFSLSFPSTWSLSLCLRLHHHSLAPYLSLTRSAAGRDPVAARLLMDATCERHTSCRMSRFRHFIYPLLRTCTCLFIVFLFFQSVSPTNAPSESERSSCRRVGCERHTRVEHR